MPSKSKAKPRPIYETALDRKRANFLAKQMLRKAKWPMPVGNMRRLPAMYGCDFSIEHADKVIGLLEVKARGFTSDAHKTIIMGLNKLVALRALALHTGLPVFVLIGFDDGYCAWFNIDSQMEYVEYGGRIDRGDANDFEPVAHFAIANMEIFKADKEGSNG